jgi:VanZ family protein
VELFRGADKLIHFTMYFILGFGLVWSLRATRYKFNRYIVLIAALVGLLYGAFDEFHQSFVPGRMASPFDLIADGLGCFAGAWVAMVAARWLRREKAATA